VLWGVFVNETSFSAFPFGFFPPENMGAVSSEDGERLRWDISGMEKGYNGKLIIIIIFIYCNWVVTR